MFSASFGHFVWSFCCAYYAALPSVCAASSAQHLKVLARLSSSPVVYRANLFCSALTGLRGRGRCAVTGVAVALLKFADVDDNPATKVNTESDIRNYNNYYFLLLAMIII
jgi:hypothetical protein